MSPESLALARATSHGLTRIAGDITAEFRDPSDACAFRDAKGPGYTVTPGINYSYAVRTVRYANSGEPV